MRYTSTDAPQTKIAPSAIAAPATTAVHIPDAPASPTCRLRPAPFTVVSFVTVTSGVNADALLPYTYDCALAGLLCESAQVTETDSTSA